MEYEMSPTQKKTLKTAISEGINSDNMNERLMAICLFFNMFCWIYNPKDKTIPAHLPFILFPFQVKYLEDFEKCYVNQEDFLTEKSRDMGATWMFCCWCILHFFYEEAFNAHIIGKKKDDLDSKTMDQVFPKMKYVLKRMPEYMLPPDFTVDRNYNNLRIDQPHNENSITGESANPDAGRSRRYGIVILDEFQKNPYDYSIWQGLADTTACRAPVGTPYGKGNKFADLRFGGQTKVFTLDWKEHPLKTAGLYKMGVPIDEKWHELFLEKHGKPYPFNTDGNIRSPWLDKEEKRRTPAEMASEIFISYSGSKQGTVYASFNRMESMCDVEYDDRFPLYTTWDFGIGDATAILWIQLVENQIRIVDALEFNNVAIDFYAPFITGDIPRITTRNQPWEWSYTPHQMEQIENHGEWDEPTRNYGDEDCKKRELTSGTSAYLILPKYGIHIFTKKKSVIDRIDRTKVALNDYKLLVNRKLAWVCDCFENYRWPTNEGGVVKGVKPVHDEFCHTPKAFEYFCSMHNFKGGDYHGQYRPAGMHMMDPDMGI